MALRESEDSDPFILAFSLSVVRITTGLVISFSALYLLSQANVKPFRVGLPFVLLVPYLIFEFIALLWGRTVDVVRPVLVLTGLVLLALYMYLAWNLSVFGTGISVFVLIVVEVFPVRDVVIALLATVTPYQPESEF